MEEAHSRVGAYSDMYGRDAEMYRGIASRRKMNADDVIQKFGPFDPWQPASANKVPEAPPLQEGSTATNPKTGEKIIFKGGQWVPVK
jgi:hypothetical protein